MRVLCLQDGSTALILAAKQAREECVGVLVEAGADVNATDKVSGIVRVGQNVSNHAMIGAYTLVVQDGWTALMFSASVFRDSGWLIDEEVSVDLCGHVPALRSPHHETLGLHERIAVLYSMRRNKRWRSSA